MSPKHSVMVPKKDKIKKLIRFWKNTKLFSWIDACVSNYFRRGLKNDNFTILCSNCIGGIIYHRLGKRFLTPTINMWMLQPDFAEFCLHLDYYLVQELIFIASDYNYPVAQIVGNGKDIPAITLFFNHAENPEEACEKWTERKQRIVRDNMFLMLYNLDGITVEKIKQLENVPCRNRVVFTPTPIPEIDWSVYIKPVMSHLDPYNYLEKDVFGVRYFEKKFDFVSFLNK